jgi:hypothetical protein
MTKAEQMQKELEAEIQKASINAQGAHQRKHSGKNKNMGRKKKKEKGQ